MGGAAEHSERLRVRGGEWGSGREGGAVAIQAVPCHHRATEVTEEGLNLGKINPPRRHSGRNEVKTRNPAFFICHREPSSE